MKFIIQLLGSISYGLGQWLIIFIFTRLYGADFTGKYLYLLGIFTPLVILANYGVRISLSTDNNNEFSLSNYRALSHISLVFYIFFSLLFILLNIDDEYIYLIFFVIFFKMSEVLLDPLNGYFVRAGMSNVYAISKILRLFLSVFLFGLFYYFLMKESIYSIMGFIFSIYLLYFFYDRVKGRNFYSIKPNFENIVKLLKFNMAIVLTSFLIALNVSIPRFFIGENSLDILAVFGILISFSSIASMPISSSIQVLYSKRKDFFIRYNKRINLIIITYSFSYFLFMFFFLEFLINKVYTVEYNFSVLERFNIALLGFFQIFLVWSNFKVLRIRKFNAAMKLAISSCILLFISCWLLGHLIHPLNTATLSVLIITIYMIVMNSYIIKERK